MNYMRIFSDLIAVLFFVLQVQLVYANCADISRQANSSFASVITAKDLYKEEIFHAQSKPPTIESLSAAISSTEKMKGVIDDAIVILNQSKAEGCFDKDADIWTSTIAQFRLQSNETAKSREILLKLRSEMMDRQPEVPSESQHFSQSGPDMQLTGDNNKDLRDQFRRAATCVAYWRISNECLSTTAPKQGQEVGLYLDIMTNRMSELGDGAKLSREDQGLFESAIKESMHRSIGGKCDNFSKLVPTYRDKCAAIFKDNASRTEKSLDHRGIRSVQ